MPAEDPLTDNTSSSFTLLYKPMKVHQRVNQRVNKRASHWYHVELLSLPGELFLRMLKMLILPLIMFSLMAGLGSLDTKVAGTLGWRTVLYYMTTTLIAVVLGLTLVMVIQPGGRGKVDKHVITPPSQFKVTS